ncbi:MAG: ankyrin repeat domain-containing protein, partial [Desulfatitalea sp.]
KGADVHKTDNDGWSALMWAAERNYFNIAQLLLDSGAQVDQPDLEGWTPLMRAAKADHKETVQVLLQKGADVSRKNKEGKSALDYAKGWETRRLMEHTTSK